MSIFYFYHINYQILRSWIFNALIESAWCSIMPLFFLSNNNSRYGTLSSFWEAGALCFTSVIIIANFKLFTIQTNWYLTSFFVIALSIASWIIIGYAINVLLVLDFDFYHILSFTLSNNVFWISLVIIVGTVSLKDLVLAIVKRFYFPSPYEYIQEFEKLSKRRRKKIIRYGDRPIPSKAERKKTILERRGCFRWLPIFFHTDLVHGSWYYVLGSAVSGMIPAIPLISLYYGLVPIVNILPLTPHATAYALLVFVGVMYTVGSLGYLRAQFDPPVPPLFKWKHFQTDELFAMWMFTIGTVPTIPIMAIYVYYNQSDRTFQLALVICIIASIGSLIMTFYCYPSEGKEGEGYCIYKY